MALATLNRFTEGFSEMAVEIALDQLLARFASVEGVTLHHVLLPDDVVRVLVFEDGSALMAGNRICALDRIDPDNVDPLIRLNDLSDSLDEPDTGEV